MDGNTDRRIVRTRLVIRDALTELIEEKGFEAVSVKDITTRANINRGTFYLHYRDKFDLLEQSEAEVIEGIIAIITKATSEDLETYRETGISVSLIVTVFEYIEEHAAFLKAILGPKGDVSFQSQLKAMFRKNLLEKNLSPLIRKENLQVPAEYFLSYVVFRPSRHYPAVADERKTGNAGRDGTYSVAAHVPGSFLCRRHSRRIGS